MRLTVYLDFFIRNNFKRVFGFLLFSIANTPSTKHFFSLFNKIEESARSPKIKLNAPTTMLFPAPVSPVIILKCSEKLISIESIIA
jgi:hypothetical protein